MTRPDLRFDVRRRKFVASCAALRGMRRLAILLLLLSVIYPTYFGWPVNLIPLVLVGYLIFLGVVRAS